MVILTSSWIVGVVVLSPIMNIELVAAVSDSSGHSAVLVNAGLGPVDFTITGSDGKIYHEAIVPGSEVLVAKAPASVSKVEFSAEPPLSWQGWGIPAVGYIAFLAALLFSLRRMRPTPTTETVERDQEAANAE
jgi:hypothetical protein